MLLERGVDVLIGLQETLVKTLVEGYCVQKIKGNSAPRGKSRGRLMKEVNISHLASAVLPTH